MNQFREILKNAIKSQVISCLPPSYKLGIYNAGSRILPQYKCIFIHVPKTGGTSISQALSIIASAKPKDIAEIPFNFEIALHKHATALEMKRWLGDSLYQEYFSFAFVRNPWDLMVSYYHYWIQTQNKRLSRYGDMSAIIQSVKKLDNFNDFMRSDYAQKLLFKGKEEFHWISDKDQVIVDKIGKYETLEEDWKQICYSLEINYVPLPKMNSSIHKPYQDYYTESTKQIVAQKFRKTIERFNYTF